MSTKVAMSCRLTSRNSSNSQVENHCDDCSVFAVKARQQSVGRPDSAKIRKILELLKQIDERSENADKTIIFSQFTSMLDLIEPFLRDKGIRFVRCELCFKQLFVWLTGGVYR